MINWDGIARHVADSLVAQRDFSNVDVRRLSGNLYDIKRRAEAVLEKLDGLQSDDDWRDINLAEARDTDLDDGSDIGYNLDMIEQLTGAFRYM